MAIYRKVWNLAYILNDKGVVKSFENVCDRETHKKEVRHIHKVIGFFEYSSLECTDISKLKDLYNE